MKAPAKNRHRPATSSQLWDLKWVREPQQDRGARTRGQLLNATEELLAKEGIAGVTIAKVTKLAQSSNGSFYHYFEDKQALLYAVVERRSIEVSVTVAQGLDPAVWADVPVLEILEGYLRFALKNGKRNPGLLEAQQVLAREDPNIARRWDRTNQETRRAIMAILEPKICQIGHPRPMEALRLTLETLRAMIDRRLQLGNPSHPTLMPKQSEEAFVKEMRAMAAGYLQISE